MEETLISSNENKYLASLNSIIVANENALIGVDNLNILYLWGLKYKNDDANDSNIENMEDFTEITTLLPNSGYFVDSNAISRIKKLNEKSLIVCGDSNTYLINIDELEKNYTKSTVTQGINSLKIKKLKNKICEFKDRSECNCLINGFDIDVINNKLLTFSDNDYCFIYDIETQKNLCKLNKLSFQFKPYVSSVLCGSILPEYNRVFLGLSEGYMQFYDIRNGQYIGTFSPLLNQFFTNKESLQNSQINQKLNDSISAVNRYSNNSLIVGCNSYGFKYNLDLNIVTQVFQNKGQINDIQVNDNCIYFASNSRSVLKYDSSAKILSRINTSSSCVYSIESVKFNGKNAFAVSGNSNSVDIFKNQIVLKLNY